MQHCESESVKRTIFPNNTNHRQQQTHSANQATENTQQTTELPFSTATENGGRRNGKRPNRVALNGISAQNRAMLYGKLNMRRLTESCCTLNVRYDIPPVRFKLGVCAITTGVVRSCNAVTTCHTSTVFTQ